MPALMTAAEDLKAKLATYDGVYQIQDDFRPGKNEIRLRLKPEARTMGLTTADLARQVYAGYFGEEALRLQRGRDDIRVRVRYTADERERVSDFEKVRIRTPQGAEVPLLSVAELDFGPGYASIQRTDGMRRVAVTAEVDVTRANANEVFNDLSAGFFQKLEFENPGVMVSLQGEKEKMRESLGSLVVTYPLALLGIYIIIATVFRSYIQPMIIMVTIPFGLIGATIGHLLMGYELSMMSMFGMVALSGVVVNDAIVLIECVNELVARGMPYFDALCRAGVRRFRAIFLTTVTTVGGLAPLMLEQDMQARFLIPMAISLSAGVAFATLLTLFLIPCLLAIVNDVRCLFAYWRTGTWPVREQVEPARFRNLDPDEIALHTIPSPARIQ
jgi:multidrug efflux pump subunit AcrB